MDLDEAADTLYALPRAEFTPARDARVTQVRAGGERELAAAIGRLRRPTVAAWLVNQLARQRPEELAALATLGEALRAAHQNLDGPGLRRLSEQRHDLVAALLRSARLVGGGAGQDVSDAVTRELEEMFASALAAQDAAHALASGRLSSPKELAEAGALDWPSVAPGARPQQVESAAESLPPMPPAQAPRSPPSPASGPAPPRERAVKANQSPERAVRAGAGVAAAGPGAAVGRARAELERVRAALAEAGVLDEDARRALDDAAVEESAAHRAVADRRAEVVAAEQHERDARTRARAARRNRADAARILHDAHRREAVAVQRLAALEGHSADHTPT